MRRTRLAVPFALAAGLSAAAASAATFTVAFNPASPANTNGWDLGSTVTNTSKYSTQPGGRKFAPGKKNSSSIESPLYPSSISSVALSAWGSGINSGNTSKLEVFGRATISDDYQLLFTRTSLANTLVENEPCDRFPIPNDLVPADFVCHQLKITYTQDIGSWTLATVTLTDDRESNDGETKDDDSDGETDAADTGDDAQLSPPTNLRAVRKKTDGSREAFEVSWTLPSGIATSEYQVLEVTTNGGIDGSQPVWRETFADVPARATAKLATAEMMSDWGLSAWGFETVYQKFEGALLVGGESDKAGALVTPPLAQSLESGHRLVVRANKHDTKTEGKISVSRISGATTNSIDTLGLPLASSLLSLQLPALSAGDRILLQPRAIDGVKNHKTIVDEIAICQDFIPETVTTNEMDITSTDETSRTISTANERTVLLFRIRSVSGDERSAWTETVRLDALATSGDSGDDSDAGDDGDDGGETGGDATLAAPGDVRAGTLPDGRIRLGWTTPDGATNVKLRVYTLATEGGIAKTNDDDILWRETFANSPATNSTVNIDDADKFTKYTDKGADGWDASRCVSVALATEARAIKIGTKDKTGFLASKPLGVSGDGLTLVVTAKWGTSENNSGVLLRPSLLPGDVTTKTLGQTTLTSEFAEYVFSASLTGGESLLLESVIDSPKDGRIILDDIALVRNYTPVHTVTNEMAILDLGAEDEECELDAAGDGVVRYAALCAQDATGATSEWTETIALDPSSLGEWQDRHLSFDSHGNLSATLDLASLPATSDTKLNVSDSPFRFLLDDTERLEINRNKNMAKITSGGVYVCTNLFENDWIVLTPYSADKKDDIRTAEMRVAIETGEFAARKVAISGTFAQLGVSNADKRDLQFQWRCLATDALTNAETATDWLSFDGMSAFATTYTAADAADDADIDGKLRETVATVTAEATLKLSDGMRPKAGDQIEVRVLNRRGKDEKEAPLGFRDFRISAESAPKAVFFVIR